jgi:hypothetical protein
MADLGPSRVGQDQKEAPPKAGQGIMLGALSGQPLGIGGDVGGRPARLSPYLAVSVPWFKPPQASHKTQTRSCCSVRLGDRVGRGRGARGSNDPSGAPGFSGSQGRGTTLASALANGWPRASGSMSTSKATAGPSSPMPASLASKALCQSARTPPTVRAARWLKMKNSDAPAVKMKNSDAPAVKREAEEEWGKQKWR